MIKINMRDDKKTVEKVTHKICGSNMNSFPTEVKRIKEPFENPDIINKIKRIERLEELKKEILLSEICEEENLSSNETTRKK